VKNNIFEPVLTRVEKCEIKKGIKVNKINPRRAGRGL
jgi:hypothetical protein